MLHGLTSRVIGGDHLTDIEAEQALETILQPDCPDVAIASFLTALTMKGETAEEIAGFARVMRRHAVRIHCDFETFLDTAGTGGGRESFNISTTAAFVIAGAGLAVAKHGNRAVTSRSGSADFLSALGIRIDVPPEVSEKCLNEFGMAFLFAPLFHPAMKRVAAIRRQIGHRTIFNLLGPLTNPAEAPFQLVGVYSRELAEKLAQALSRLGCRGAWVVHSDDGMDELSVRADSLVFEAIDNRVRSFSFSPRPWGLAHYGLTGYPAGDAEENARICRDILEGRTSGAVRDVVVLNAAAALHVSGEADFAIAVARAQESIDSGSALEKLSRLAEVSRGGH